MADNFETLARALSRRRFLRTSTLAAAAIGTQPMIPGGDFALGQDTLGDDSVDVKHDTDNKTDELTLWYDRPAKVWMTEALPIGNGPLGAMLFGGTETERIQFNEISLWTGDRVASGVLGETDEEEEQNLGAHQAFGDVYIDLGHDFASVSHYRRELDIDRAIHQVSYQHEGVQYRRTAFASHPDGVIVVHLTADQPGALSGRVRLTDMHDAKIDALVSADGHPKLTSVGTLGNGFAYEAQLVAKCDDGTVAIDDHSDSSRNLRFENCNSLTLILAAGTNFAQDHTKQWLGDHPHDSVTARVSAAAQQDVTALTNRHVEDHQAIFRRFAINLGTTSPELLGKTTLARLQSYAANGTSESGLADPALEALFCQFGRYLLISCSRPGSLPAN